MAVITIPRQYGSGGNVIATRFCEMLGYRYFDKSLMAQMSAEVGLSRDEMVDFSEEKHQVGGRLDGLLHRRRSRRASVCQWRYCHRTRRGLPLRRWRPRAACGSSTWPRPARRPCSSMTRRAPPRHGALLSARPRPPPSPPCSGPATPSTPSSS